MVVNVPTRIYDAVVVGAGGAGIAAVGALLHFHRSIKVGWVDPDFSGGRLSRRYRDVSSNTKTALFLQYADTFAPFRAIVASTPGPNAITALEALNRDRGCRLGYAADMLSMLTSGLRKLPNVDALAGNIAQADFETLPARWSIRFDSKTPKDQNIFSRSLVMCTGSSPSTISLPSASPTMLDLDTVLDRPKLRSSLSPDAKKPLVVGIIGTSHSAIVAIMNLYELATQTHPHLQIKWFVRSPLIYAVHMDGWILRDNTGLKGASAEFAREHLEDNKLVQSPLSKILTKVACPDIREASMEPQLSACTHVVPAIGYTRDPIPQLAVDGVVLEGITHNPTEGSLLDDKGQAIPRAYGAGIAFPERVTDPANNTESAVGLWKFIKHVQRVGPSWV